MSVVQHELQQVRDLCTVISLAELSVWSQDRQKHIKCSIPVLYCSNLSDYQCHFNKVSHVVILARNITLFRRYTFNNGFIHQ